MTPNQVMVTRYINARLTKLESLLSFENYKDLSYLYAPQNEITSLEGIENIVNLKSICLRENKIQHIVIKHKIQHLDTIDLRENKILSFEGIENLLSLKSVVLSYHPESIDVIKKLISKKITIYLDSDELISHKLNLYKFIAVSWLSYDRFGHYLARIRISKVKSKKLIVKTKILTYWFSFFEDRKDKFGYNRLSFLCWN